MRDISIKENNNSFKITFAGINKPNGEYSYSTSILDTVKMLEVLGEVLLDRKIKVVNDDATPFS